MAFIDFKISEIDSRHFLTYKQHVNSKKSALGSTGFFLRKQVADNIEASGGAAGNKWKKLHPMSRLSSLKQFGKVAKKRVSKKKKPLAKFKKYIRYDADGDRVHIKFTTFGKSKPGTVDRNLKPIVERHETGRVIRLTEKSRKFRAALGFPVRPSTTVIRLPERKPFSVIAKQNEAKLPKVFAEKYEASVMRKLERKKKPRVK